MCAKTEGGRTLIADGSFFRSCRTYKEQMGYLAPKSLTQKLLFGMAKSQAVPGLSERPWANFHIERSTNDRTETRVNQSRLNFQRSRRPKG